MNRRGFLAALGVSAAAPAQAVKSLGLVGGIDGAATVLNGDSHESYGNTLAAATTSNQSPLAAIAEQVSRQERKRRIQFIRESAYRVGVLEPSVAANRSWSSAFSLSVQRERDARARREIETLQNKAEELWEKFYNSSDNGIPL